MPETIRLALVGAGLITRSSHLPAALAAAGVEVAALVDPVKERAAALARDFGITPRIGAAVEEVLDYIDAAVIATPNDTHAANALACIERDVPVLIEKPLASSYEEGAAIVTAADKRGTPVAVGYSTRFRPNIVLLKALLDEGYFGTVRRFVHQFGTPGGWAPLSGYNLDRKSAGGGVLVVTGTHFLDRMLYFWGYPDEVVLEDDGCGGPEANCTAKFMYSRPGTSFDGFARYSKTARMPAGMVVETDHGHVVLQDRDDAEIVFRPHDSSAVEHAVRRRAAGQESDDVALLQLEDFVSACRERRSPRVDGRQGLQSLKLLDALYAHRRTVDPEWYGGEPLVQVAA